MSASDRLEDGDLDALADEIVGLPVEVATEVIYARWDPHSEVDLDQRDAEVEAWEAVNPDGYTDDADAAAAWYIAADSAWVAAALPSNTLTRNEFMEQWLAGQGAVPAQDRLAGEPEIRRN